VKLDRRDALRLGFAAAVGGPARVAAGRKGKAYTRVLTDGARLVSRQVAVTIGGTTTVPLANRPTQAATIAWEDTGDPANAALANYAADGALISVGRTNYADQVVKDVSAAGGTVLIYLDAVAINNFGRYHSLLFDSSVYGAAVPQWGSYMANTGLPLADFRVGGILQGKLEAVLELMVSENPHMGGWFADDLGSRSWFPLINWGTVPQTDKDAYRAGAIALAQTFRTVADRHKLVYIVNGTWTGGDGGGYPNTALDGCSLADGGYVEHHDGEISFWGPYATATQWASGSAVTNGTSFMWAVMNTSAGQTEFVNSNAFAFVNTQTTANYDVPTAPWGTFHRTGLPSHTS
jgi:hypothetical protein